jgi:outer membrane lipoprotein-sorting protein
MKKFFMINAVLLVMVSINAQTLEEIAVKNYQATNQEAFEKAKTVIITAKTVQGGIEIPMVISLKNPDKVRVEMTYQGMVIIQAYDGENGYVINPMMGSNDPVAMPANEAANMKNQTNFSSQLMQYLKEDRLEMAGDATISGKTAWKLKATLPTGDVTYVYIDKSSYLQVKSDMKVAQMGMDMDIEAYMSDYTDFSGLLMPKTTTTYANGEEMMVMIIEKVEVDKTIDDSKFTLK